MRDEITIKRIQLMHPNLRNEVAEIYEEICKALTDKVGCRFAYTLRTMEEQDALYAIGRTKPGNKVTNARGGESMHNYGLALDIVLLIDKDGNGTYETASWNRAIDVDGDHISDWQEIVNIFKMYGWEWGGNWNTFPDYPHFQKSYGLSIKRLQKCPKIPGTNYPHNLSI